MRCWWLLLWSVCVAARAAAAPSADLSTVPLDANRSHAAFEVRLLFLVGLHGEFGAVSGAVHVTAGKATVDADIATNDLRMRSRRYETWAKSAEFFDAQQFPQIHFTSEPFPVTRLADGGTIAGTLTLRGVARHATFVLERPDCAAPLAGACAVMAQGTIRRSEFGMRSRRGALSDKVDLQLSIQLQPDRRP
jgi:polyisoprenoid-binding protein YceI